MERVFILAPYNPDSGEESLAVIVQICKMARAAGLAPVAPQFYLPKMFNYKVATEYVDALVTMCSILQGCDLVWMYGPVIGQFTEPIAVAVDFKIPIAAHGLGSINSEQGGA